MTKKYEAEWDTIDRKATERRLGPEAVQAAREHAAESFRLSRKLLRLHVPSGLVLVIHGPLIPVLKSDLSPMPASASPGCYQIVWYGRPGAEYPPEVDNNVLMRTEGHQRIQVWAMDAAADVVRVIKTAFEMDVTLPREEPKS